MVYVTLPWPYFTIYLHGKMNKFIYMYINTCICTIGWTFDLDHKCYNVCLQSYSSSASLDVYGSIIFMMWNHPILGLWIWELNVLVTCQIWIRAMYYYI